MNNSFYRLPEKEKFKEWKKKTTADFIFSVKANRFITHMKKLKDPEEALEHMLHNAAGLGKKLGPVLFQLPPNWKINTERLESFLKLLPKKHRYVFEFRNDTWYEESVFKLLKKYNCAFCIYELAGHLSPLLVTADFVYLRLHGPGGKYQGNYSEQKLKFWAATCKEWMKKKKDVYVYFDNDQGGFAAFNAQRLKQLLK